MPKQELHGRDPVAFKSSTIAAPDITFSGLTGTYFKLKNYDDVQDVIYCVGPTGTFPAKWEKLFRGEEIVVPSLGAAAVSFRKMVFFRNIAMNADNTTRTNDVSVTVGLEERDVP